MLNKLLPEKRYTDVCAQVYKYTELNVAFLSELYYIYRIRADQMSTLILTCRLVAKLS